MWDLGKHNEGLSPEEKEKLQESKKINEALIKRNGAFGLLDERIVYDRNFLIEVQNAGYNPLDKEDVNNFLEQKPPKNAERNIILCGANKYSSMGQGEYEEADISKYQKKYGIESTLKKTEDVHLSELKNKEREMLLESVQETNMDVSDVEIDYNKFTKYKSLQEAEDVLRKNIAKAFGADDMIVKKEEYIQEKNTQIVKKDGSVEKTLELIKELRALGFSPDEIKQQLQNRQ